MAQTPPPYWLFYITFADNALCWQNHHECKFNTECAAPRRHNEREENSSCSGLSYEVTFLCALNISPDKKFVFRWQEKKKKAAPNAKTYATDLKRRLRSYRRNRENFPGVAVEHDGHILVTGVKREEADFGFVDCFCGEEGF